MTLSRSAEKKLLQESCDARLCHLKGDSHVANHLGIEALPARDGHGDSLERVLLARGIRLTEQRRAILQVIELAPQCGNVGVICRRARKLNSRINRATVYRTVALLKRHGVLSDCGHARPCTAGMSPAALVEGRQIRMKCLGCGKAIEFDCCLLGELAQSIERDCYFRVVTAQLDLEGYCRECRALNLPSHERKALVELS